MINARPVPFRHDPASRFGVAIGAAKAVRRLETACDAAVEGLSS